MKNDKPSKSQQATALAELAAHFEKTGWPYELSREKLWQRGSVVTDADHADCAIVEIERHRAVLGSVYVREQPMSAFETYFMRYRIQGQMGDVTELAERVMPVQINVGALANELLASNVPWFGIMRTARGYVVQDRISKATELVSSLDRIKGFLADCADECSEYFGESLSRAEPPIADALRVALEHEYAKILNERFSSMAAELWSARDEESD